MRFLVDALAIQKAIKSLGVVAKINAVDGTGKVLVDCTEGSVNFSASNGPISITISVTDVEVEETGRVAFLYSKIRPFILSFRPWDGEVGAKVFSFDSNDGRTTNVSVDNSTENGKVVKGALKLSNVNPALLAPVPTFEQTEFILNSTIFRTATDKILYSIDPTVETAGFSMKGMHVKFTQDSIYFAGTNGRTVSEYQVKNVSSKVDEEFTFSYDFVMGLRRLVTDDRQMFFETKGNKVKVKVDNMIFSGQLIISGSFPDYQPWFNQFTEHINLNKEFLVGALSPIVDVLDGDDNFRLTLEIRNNVFRLFNDAVEIESDQGIQAGQDYSVDVNGRLLLKTIDAIKDDYLLFKFEPGTKVMIFDSSTYNDQKAIVVGMKKR